MMDIIQTSRNYIDKEILLSIQYYLILPFILLSKLCENISTHSNCKYMQYE